VLVEFWTFACWNCQNVEPHVKAWHAKYQAAGLRVIGVHCPELDRERELANLRAYVREHGIAYPVLIDNAFRTWRAYGNRYWPALYLVDKRGLIRHVAIGEGRYAETEAKIRELLAEQLHKSESGTFLRKSALELQGGSSQGAANPRRAAATVSAW
jgi:thiol-disulfide isomerase/thioredoxin